MAELSDIKDFDTMVANTLQKIVNANIGITNTSVGSVVRALVEALVDNNSASNYSINYVYNAMGIDDATDTDLDRLVALLGITRHSATYATGVVTMSTGDEPYPYDISIPYGQLISTRQGTDGTIKEFIVTDEELILAAGIKTINVNVKSTVTGHVYLPAGTLNILSTSINGIQSVTNTNEINGGADKESDIDLRQRSKDTISSFGKCTDNALKVAIENIAGVLSCSVIDQYNGVGTSEVIVATSIMPAPDNVKLLIEQAVKDTKASGIYVLVKYPDIKYIEVNIIISIDSPALILGAISSYVNSLEVGQTFIVKQMERKILNVLDDNHIENDSIDITTTLPAGNITATVEEIIRINTITINGVIYNV